VPFIKGATILVSVLAEQSAFLYAERHKASDLASLPILPEWNRDQP